MAALWTEIDRVTSNALRRLGAWPAAEDQTAVLVSAILAAAEATDDPEERGKLLKAAGYLGGVGSDILSGIVANLVVAGTTGAL